MPEAIISAESTKAPTVRSGRFTLKVTAKNAKGSTKATNSAADPISDTSGMKGAYINLNDFPSPSQMVSPVYEDVYENCGIIRVVMPYLETPIASMPFTGGRLLLVLAAISSLSLVVGLVLLRPQKTGRKH